MKKEHSYLAVWFLVVFVIRGFHTDDPYEVITYGKCLERENRKYGEITAEKINELKDFESLSNKLPKIHPIEFIFFYHGGYFNVKDAHRLMVRHYEIRNELNTIFYDDEEDPKLEELEEVQKFAECSILFSDSYVTKGYRYVYTSVTDPDPKHFDLAKFLRYFFYMMKCLLIEYGTADGVVVIMNAKNVSLKHYWHLKKTAPLKVVGELTHYLPLRLKQIYVLNSSRFTKLIHMLASGLQMESRVKMYTPGYTKFYDDGYINMIPKTIMPVGEYQGGSGPSIQDQTLKTLALMKKLHNQYCVPKSND